MNFSLLAITSINLVRVLFKSANKIAFVKLFCFKLVKLKLLTNWLVVLALRSILGLIILEQALRISELVIKKPTHLIFLKWLFFLILFQ
ncbi:hypothetical protein [[Mycoplasma] cavipharyngis]|uniref:hypothetical protein n=1 Tax=[Mycoplasma] cavipharyngis TaxID=92757 RepID=UPI003703D0DD